VKYSLVVIDDARLVRESIAALVGRGELGCEIVGQAEDGELGEALIRNLLPDIVITDIRMPAKDGLELALLARGIAPGSKVIVITGFREFEYAQRALKLGVSDLITKPFRDETMEAALRKAVTQLAAERGDSEVPGGSLAASMIEYLRSHYAENLSLSEIADTYHISDSHASRLIKEAKGVGFAALLTELRVERAKSLLADPRIRIKEVASLVGYPSYDYFYKVFKKAVSLSPEQFRASLSK
jgi:two-component system, response regulator YesN